MEKKVKKVEVKKAETKKFEVKQLNWIWSAFAMVFMLIFLFKKVIIDILDWMLRSLPLPLLGICLLIFFLPLYSPQLNTQLKTWWENWRKG